jgi:hypothetical protein
VTLDIRKLMFISSKILKSFIKVTIIYYEKVNRLKWTRNIWYKNWDIKVLWPPFKFLIAHPLFSCDHLLCYSYLSYVLVITLYVIVITRFVLLITIWFTRPPHWELLLWPTNKFSWQTQLLLVITRQNNVIQVLKTSDP